MSTAPATETPVPAVDLYTHPDVLPDEMVWLTPWRQLCRIQPGPAPAKREGFALALDAGGLALLPPVGGAAFRLQSSMLERRLDRRNLIHRAAGPGRPGRAVLDPFAGYGLDGLALAARNATVTLVEREPLVCLLLAEFAHRMDYRVLIQHADALAVLEAGGPWDVVYLDPMFPARNKRALPNLGMQYLRDLCRDPAPDLESCVALARKQARERVVLKRRLKDPVVGRPGHQLRGRTVRYDVYAS